jgi:hypothetical protein
MKSICGAASKKSPGNSMAAFSLRYLKSSYICNSRRTSAPPARQTTRHGIQINLDVARGELSDGLVEPSSDFPKRFAPSSVVAVGSGEWYVAQDGYRVVDSCIRWPGVANGGVGSWRRRRPRRQLWRRRLPRRWFWWRRLPRRRLRRERFPQWRFRRRWISWWRLRQRIPWG